MLSNIIEWLTVQAGSGWFIRVRTKEKSDPEPTFEKMAELRKKIGSGTDI